MIPAYPLGRGLPRRPGIVGFSWNPPNSGPGGWGASRRPRQAQIKKHAKCCSFHDIYLISWKSAEFSIFLDFGPPEGVPRAPRTRIRWIPWKSYNPGSPGESAAEGIRRDHWSPRYAHLGLEAARAVLRRRPASRAPPPCRTHSRTNFQAIRLPAKPSNFLINYLIPLIIYLISLIIYLIPLIIYLVSLIIYSFPQLFAWFP